MQIERRLYVTWRHPQGTIMPIGLLTQRSDGYEFVYLKLAEQQPRFAPLPGLPDLYRRYTSDQLFPVFANRQMPRERADYDAFVEQLHLDREADPFEVLTRSEGMRATDRIEVFAAPIRTSNGELRSHFFVRGVRHISGAADAITTLSPGDELQLVAERDNVVNPRAMLLHTRTGEPVGYTPDYLLETIQDLTEYDADGIQVTVEHANPQTSAPHMRLLCRLSAPWPNGYEALSGPDFQPLAS